MSIVCLLNTGTGEMFAVRVTPAHAF